jgi:hypothetical protein
MGIVWILVGLGLGSSIDIGGRASVCMSQAASRQVNHDVRVPEIRT